MPKAEREIDGPEPPNGTAVLVFTRPSPSTFPPAAPLPVVPPVFPSCGLLAAEVNNEDVGAGFAAPVLLPNIGWPSEEKVRPGEPPNNEVLGAGLAAAVLLPNMGWLSEKEVLPAGVANPDGVELTSRPWLERV